MTILNDFQTSEDYNSSSHTLVEEEEEQEDNIEVLSHSQNILNMPICENISAISSDQVSIDRSFLSADRIEFEDYESSQSNFDNAESKECHIQLIEEEQEQDDPLEPKPQIKNSKKQNFEPKLGPTHSQKIIIPQLQTVNTTIDTNSYSKIAKIMQVPKLSLKKQPVDYFPLPLKNLSFAEISASRRSSLGNSLSRPPKLEKSVATVGTIAVCMVV